MRILINLISQKLMTKEKSVNCWVTEQIRPNDRCTAGNLNKQ